MASANQDGSQKRLGPQPAGATRKVRIVCVSDTHNKSPRDGCFKLPPGDVLIHAGDLTNQGTLRELRDALDWIEAADYEVKIVVAGNHDITLDEPYYEKKGREFHGGYLQSPQECQALMRSFPGITYLQHETITLSLANSREKPGVSFRVFGSPYSPGNGTWGFGYAHKHKVYAETWNGGRIQGASDSAPEDADAAMAISPQSGQQLWEAIPDDVDITVTHVPPLGHRDEGRRDRSCPDLLDALRQVRPRLAVCGHIHEGWGAELVIWGNHQEEDPIDHTMLLDVPKDGKKLAKIDLTSNGRLRDWPTALSFKVDGDQHGRTGTPDSIRDEESNMTCVVNAAVKARSFRSSGDGPQFHKAVVIDLDLPAKCQ